MQLYNATSGKKIMGKTRLAEDAVARCKGLMFEHAKKFDYALVFAMPHETRLGASVHMLFVFFPIDIVFLDANKRVVDKATLKPWRLNYTPRAAAKYFIELPEGKASGIKAGNKIEWRDS